MTLVLKKIINSAIIHLFFQLLSLSVTNHLLRHIGRTDKQRIYKRN